MSGSLALLWDKNITVSFSFSRPHIAVQVHINNGFNDERLTSFYGSPDQVGKTKSWDLLHNLHCRVALPRLCSGDFNAILFQHKKESSCLAPLAHILNFWQAIKGTGRINLGFERDPSLLRQTKERLHLRFRFFWIQLLQMYDGNRGDTSFK
ncbi:hypothetical protein Salat_2429600 [Sesamum alatum]|uniref:Endonuclease/exonuclease/phosphatase domain-containing protein n=1 Tax=Sesamum alatum TaxID=300844 RepID=A0AAE2CFG4_9LAMI|nr:hypothetical protein Salat_2429600 [Sesamum alatum]